MSDYRRKLQDWDAWWFRERRRFCLNVRRLLQMAMGSLLEHSPLRWNCSWRGRQSLVCEMNKWCEIYCGGKPTGTPSDVINMYTYWWTEVGIRSECSGLRDPVRRVVYVSNFKLIWLQHTLVTRVQDEIPYWVWLTWHESSALKLHVGYFV